MRKTILTIAMVSLISGTAFAVPTAVKSEVESSTFNLTEASIEQTNLNANVAGGAVQYGGGVSINQAGHVDSDAKPATVAAHSETEAASGAYQYSTGFFGLGGSGAGNFATSETETGFKASSGVPGAGSVVQSAVATNEGGSSSINTVLPNGTVSSSNITSQNPQAQTGQSIAATGNANAGGFQGVNAGGNGGALGGAGAIQYSNTEVSSKTIDKASFEAEFSSKPVFFFH